MLSLDISEKSFGDKVLILQTYPEHTDNDTRKIESELTQAFQDYQLENALSRYHGAVIYISHDSFFAAKVGGTTIPVGV